MQTIDHIPGRDLRIKGEKWLYFASTSYLGIAQDKRFQAKLLEGIQKYGSNFGSSRLSIPKLEVFEKAEHCLAQLCNAEKALTLSSGTLAGQVLIRHLEHENDFHYAPGTHPATWGQLQAPSISYSNWIEQILSKTNKDQNPLTFVANSVDPLYAQQYSFTWLEQLPPDIPFTLIIDDSHGLGVTGKKGGGALTTFQPPPNVKLIVVSSMAKAFGIPGGVIMGSKAIIESIYKSPYFGGASPIIPAYLHAFLNAQDYYRENRQKLIYNSQKFLKSIHATESLNYFKDYPVFYTAKNELADFLANYQILISSFSYPSPKDPKITRMVLSSWHTKEDILLLANLVNEFFADCRIADDR